MRFLQIGLGSMGKRRIRCLRALGETDIVAFDTREDRRREAEHFFGIRTVDSLERGWDLGAQAALVSTPPDAHYPFVREALSRGLHTFCEVNIVSDGAAELGALAAAKGVVAAPSATMRFHPLYGHLHRLIVDEGVLGRPLLMRFHMGNYILDWHPWEGLDFYAGRRATGACREMVPFEFQWMRWIFGEVESVQCDFGRHLDLPTDMDDAYAIVARFASGMVANVLIEVVARNAVREGSVLSQAGQLDWSFDTQRVRHYDGDSRTFREHKAAGRGFNIEEMYVAEIDGWLRAVRGEARWEHSYADDRELGRILLACEQSHETGRRVRVAEVDA